MVAMGGTALMHVHWVAGSDLLAMVGREDTDPHPDRDQDEGGDAVVTTMDAIA